MGEKVIKVWSGRNRYLLESLTAHHLVESS
jgi:hypothetical protein